MSYDPEDDDSGEADDSLPDAVGEQPVATPVPGAKNAKPPKPPVRFWCIDCQRMFDPAEGLHDSHETRETHPKGTRGAVAIGSEGSKARKETRYPSGIIGWDRVLGGGLVRGNITLFTGEEGVGKSTLMLVVLYALAKRGYTILYITGEETKEAVEGRFFGMGYEPHKNLILYATKSWELAVAEINRIKPHIILIDSLQRVSLTSQPYPEGSDDAVATLMRLIDGVAKRSKWTPSVIAIGHLNAKGEAAGRRAVRHDVDINVHFVSDDLGNRVLRSRKSRQGPSGELAYFRFQGKRIVEVPDASAALLAESIGQIGVVAYPATRLARPIVLPIEAAVSAPKEKDEPRVKRVTGLPDSVFDDAVDLLFDASGVRFSDRSVRVKAPRIGDEELAEEACTLAVCLALFVSAERLHLPPVACFGTVSPSGRVQSDAMIEARLYALKKVNVGLVIGPPIGSVPVPEGITYHPVTSLKDLVEVARTRGVFQPDDPELVAAREATRRKKGRSSTEDVPSDSSNSRAVSGSDKEHTESLTPPWEVDKL